MHLIHSTSHPLAVCARNDPPGADGTPDFFRYFFRTFMSRYALPTTQRTQAFPRSATAAAIVGIA